MDQHSGREFVRSLHETVRASKEKEAIDAAKAAQKQGDMVAAAHHEARARAFHDSWREPDAGREVDREVVSQLRASLSHADPAVRESAWQGLDHMRIAVR